MKTQQIKIFFLEATPKIAGIAVLQEKKAATWNISKAKLPLQNVITSLTVSSVYITTPSCELD